MRGLRRDESGVAEIVVPLAVVAIVILLLVLVLLPLLTPPSRRTEICGSTTTDDLKRKWLEVLLDRTDPRVRDVVELVDLALRQLLAAREAIQNVEVLFDLPDGKQAAVGKGYVYEYEGRFFVAVALYLGCTFAGESAAGYQSEVNDLVMKLAVLLAFQLLAPEGLPFIGALMFIIEMIFQQGLGWTTGSPSIQNTTPPSSLDQVEWPGTVGEFGKGPPTQYFDITR